MGGFNIQEMISQARKQYDVLQKKMQETVVEASSGGGSVTVNSGTASGTDITNSSAVDTFAGEFNVFNNDASTSIKVT